MAKGRTSRRKRCRDCTSPPVSGYARCQEHLDYHRAYHKRYVDARGARRASGICYDCNTAAVEGKTRCKDHLERNKRGVVRYLKSEKGSYYLEASAEARRESQRKSAAKTKRGGGRFNYVRANAQRSGRKWALKRDLYEELVQAPCYYCKLTNNVEAGIGLDRLDNKRGYESDNVVSCCVECKIGRAHV